MRHILIYSSLTGNTEMVARAVHSILPPETPIVHINNAPEPADYDSFILGFWVHRAKPDPRMWDYMAQIKGKTVAAFGTMVALPESDHADKVVQNVHLQLNGNTVLGCFLCQGKLAQKRFEDYMSRRKVNPHHPLTPEKRARLIEASQHPNDDDLKAAARAIAIFFHYDSGVL